MTGQTTHDIGNNPKALYFRGRMRRHFTQAAIYAVAGTVLVLGTKDVYGTLLETIVIVGGVASLLEKALKDRKCYQAAVSAPDVVDADDDGKNYMRMYLHEKFKGRASTALATGGISLLLGGLGLAANQAGADVDPKMVLTAVFMAATAMWSARGAVVYKLAEKEADKYDYTVRSAPQLPPPAV